MVVENERREQRDIVASRRTGEHWVGARRSGTSPRPRGPSRADRSSTGSRRLRPRAPGASTRTLRSSQHRATRRARATGSCSRRGSSGGQRPVTADRLAARGHATIDPVSNAHDATTRDDDSTRRAVEPKRGSCRGSPISNRRVRSIPSSHGSTIVPPQSSRASGAPTGSSTRRAFDLDESQLAATGSGFLRRGPAPPATRPRSHRLRTMSSVRAHRRSSETGSSVPTHDTDRGRSPPSTRHPRLRVQRRASSVSPSSFDVGEEFGDLALRGVAAGETAPGRSQPADEIVGRADRDEMTAHLASRRAGLARSTPRRRARASLRGWSPRPRTSRRAGSTSASVMPAGPG